MAKNSMSEVDRASWLRLALEWMRSRHKVDQKAGKGCLSWQVFPYCCPHRYFQFIRFPRENVVR